MKILYLMPFSPVPPNFGGALRAFHLLRQLARRHSVTAVGYGSEEQARELARRVPSLEKVCFLLPTWVSRHRRLGQALALGGRRSFHNLSVVGAEMQRTLDRILSTGEFDAVHTEFSHLGPFRMRTPAVKVLDAHNVEHDVFRRYVETLPLGPRRLHYWLEWKKQRREEIACCRAHDLILATSERDAQLLRHQAPGVPCHVVPNGVDSSYFTPSPAPPEPFSLVFTGMMAYLPNHDGIGWFLDEVFPSVRRAFPEAKLYVVGKAPPRDLRRRASSHVVVTGTVDDVRPWAHRAAVYVVPLRSGGGTRLKIAEALAMKIPMVTTSIGCEGIEVTDGESALVADSAEEFASAVVTLLGSEGMRRRLATRGFELVRKRYDWSAIGEQMENAYAGVMRWDRADSARAMELR
jgi:glycosyltransferase involved in cell wall biosynthesis